MQSKDVVTTPYRLLIWRLLTFSARTQISFTVREGSLFLEDGLRFVEFFLDGHSLDRPRTVIIPGPMNKLNKAIARVFLPDWMVDADYYSILEKYVAKIFMLGIIPERFAPVITLPNALYDEFLEQNRLTLDQSFKKRKRKALVVYEFLVDKGATRLRLLDGGRVILDCIAHLERRRDV